MTDVVRLTLMSHAMTDAMAAGRFPADEPLNEGGRRQAGAAAGLDLNRATRQLAAPERRARQTAELLGLQAAVEPRLADLDYGRWRGEALVGVGPEQLEAWQADQGQPPPGGESIVALIDRVARWLDSLTFNALRTVAVTHPAVIRAAIVAILDAPPKSFWRIDIAPLSRTVLHFRGQAWTLRSN
ncbi:MAG: histidine phosphatase family protein [Mycobacterium sp.]